MAEPNPTAQEIQRIVERTIAKPGVIPLNAVSGLASAIAKLQRDLEALELRVEALE